MLKCNELTEMSTDYLDGQLPLAPRVDVYLHLGFCRHCRGYLGQMKTTMKLLRQLPVAFTPARVSDELLARPRDKRLARPAVYQGHAGTLRLVDS